jgi:hypothetical protein
MKHFKGGGASYKSFGASAVACDTCTQAAGKKRMTLIFLKSFGKGK